MTDEQRIKIYEEILREHTLHLDRELVTFHYQDGAKSNFAPNTLEEAWNKVSKKPGNYFDLNYIDPTMKIGPGFYLAVDPIGTLADFGGSRPQLWAVTLKEGTRLLMATDALSGKERRLLLSALDKSQGDLPNFVQAVDILRIQNSSEVRNWVGQAFKKAGVEGIFYYYPRGGTYMPDCRKRNFAINLISADAISSVAFYSEGKTFADPALIPSGFIKSYFHAYGPQLNHAWVKENPMSSPSEFVKFRNEKILNCGPRWRTER